MSFWGSLTGSDQKKTIQKGSAQAKSDLTAGYNEANNYYNQSFDQLTPFAQQGAQDQNTYRQSLGLGTPEEQTAANDRYFNDGTQQQILGQQSNALLRGLNARGQSGGGMAALAGQRVALENFGNWQNKLAGLGAQGLQVNTQQSAIRSGQGDSRYNFGSALAGNDINTANGVASAQGVLGNNLLGALGVAAKAYGARK